MGEFDSFYMNCWNSWSNENIDDLSPSSASAHGYVGDMRHYYNNSSHHNRRRDEVMAEFRLNGLDSPYNSNEDENPFNFQEEAPLLRVRSRTESSFQLATSNSCAGTSHMEQEQSTQQMRDEQLQSLLDIPQSMLNMPVKYLEQYARPQKIECRFCKSNGERATLCVQHPLKDNLGRVVCPVLRAFKCPRCNATGDNAHTLKYCPYITPTERRYATALMRCVRLTNERRRTPQTYTPPTTEADEAWEKLERKLNAETSNNTFLYN